MVRTVVAVAFAAVVLSACRMPASLPSMTAEPDLRRALSPEQVTRTSPPSLPPSRVEPQVIRICPQDPEVPLAALQLGSAYGLVLRRSSDPPSGVPLLVSASEPSPRPIPIYTVRDGWHLTGYRISPDHRLLELDYESPTGSERSLWYSAPDGAALRRALTYDAASQAVSVDLHEIVLIGVPPRERFDGRFPWTERVPLAVFNQDTGQLEELPDLPSGALFEFLFIHGGNRYALFEAMSGPYYSHYLYAYADNTVIPVFQWLRELRGWIPLKPGIYRQQDGLFATRVMRSYGFDIAFDLSFEDILADAPYSDVMHPVVLPGGDSTDLLTWPLLQRGSDPFPVFRQSQASPTPSYFYVFDFPTMTLMDYCLDEHFLDAARVATWVGSSPDQRFIAAVVEYLVDDALGWYFETRESLLLDIGTGRFARLPGFHPVGWILLGTGE